jgi:hypothetical protein
MLPLDLHIRLEALKTYIRIRHSMANVWDGQTKRKFRKGHLFSLKSEISDQEININNLDDTHDSLQCNVVFDKKRKILNEAYVLNIYTDGSKMKDKTGAGYAIMHGNQCTDSYSLHLGNTATHSNCF